MAKPRKSVSRKQTEAERETWVKGLAPSKYAPHQGKRECARRVRREQAA